MELYKINLQIFLYGSDANSEGVQQKGLEERIFGTETMQRDDKDNYIMTNFTSLKLHLILQGKLAGRDVLDGSNPTYFTRNNIAS